MGNKTVRCTGPGNGWFIAVAAASTLGPTSSALAQASAGVLEPARLCALLAPAELVRLGATVPGEKRQQSTGPTTFPSSGRQAIALRDQAACSFTDPKQAMRTVVLTVHTAVDAKAHAALVGELHETDPADPRPPELIEWRDGYCAVDREPAIDPKQPALPPSRWTAGCSAIKGLRVVQLVISHESRAALPKLSAMKSHFDRLLTAL